LQNRQVAYTALTVAEQIGEEYHRIGVTGKATEFFSWSRLDGHRGVHGEPQL